LFEGLHGGLLREVEFNKFPLFIVMCVIPRPISDYIFNTLAIPHDAFRETSVLSIPLDLHLTNIYV
jgi:hypothetical protein